MTYRIKRPFPNRPLLRKDLVGDKQLFGHYPDWDSLRAPPPDLGWVPGRGLGMEGLL